MPITSLANPSRSKPSAIPGAMVSTATSPTFATAHVARDLLTESGSIFVQIGDETSTRPGADG